MRCSGSAGGHQQKQCVKEKAAAEKSLKMTEQVEMPVKAPHMCGGLSCRQHRLRLLATGQNDCRRPGRSGFSPTRQSDKAICRAKARPTATYPFCQPYGEYIVGVGRASALRRIYCRRRSGFSPTKCDRAKLHPIMNKRQSG